MDVPPAPPNAPAPGGGSPPRGAGLLLGGALTILGAGLLILAGVSGWHEHLFLARADHAPGLVVEMTTRWSGKKTRSPYYTPTFTFADRSGKEHRVRSRVGSNPPGYRVGENVDVFYTPQAPDKAELQGFMSQWFGTTLLGVIGTGITLFGLFALSSAVRPSGRFADNGR